jgi:AraC family transcriptional regulator
MGPNAGDDITGQIMGLHGRGAARRTTHGRGWPILAIDQSPGRHRSLSGAEIVVQTVLRGAGAVDCGHGATRFTAQARPGTTIVAPPHAELIYQPAEPLTILALIAPVDAAAGLAGLPALPEALYQRVFRDPFVSGALQRLWQEAGAEETDGAAFSGHLVASCLARLAMLAQREPEPRPAAAALSSAAVAEIEAFIERRLEDPIELADLARKAGLSVFHFARAFRAATGQPPMRFILFRRIERARELLLGSPMPLAEIAYACGFASQAHMTTAFSKLMGVTPGRMRRDGALGATG